MSRQTRQRRRGRPGRCDPRLGNIAGTRTYEALAGLYEAAAVERAASAFREAAATPPAWQDNLASLDDAAAGSARAMTDTDRSAAQKWRHLAGKMGG